MSKKKKFAGKTYILFVLDESGSMGVCREDTISGFNEFIGELKKEHADDEVLFTLTKFNTEFIPVHTAVALVDVPELSHDTYQPEGLTALYDAVAHTVKNIDKNVKKKDRALVIIMTDGQENSSKENTRDSVFVLISEKEKLGNWTFTYLGANQDSWLAGNAIGMSAGNISNYDTKNTRKAFQRMARATLNYAGGAQGQSVSFYDDED